MRSHKSLLAWQRAHSVVLAVLGCCRNRWRPYASSVFDQLQRASLSVQLNIAEGYALRSPARFRNHLTIAYGSAVETQELVELLLEAGLVPADIGDPMRSTIGEAQALILGLLKRYRREE